MRTEKSPDKKGLGNWLRHPVGVLVILLGYAAAGSAGELDLPSPPDDGAFVNDYAGMLDWEVVSKIAQLQEDAYYQHDTALVVTTIDSMADYGGEGWYIGRFAEEWFNHWEIGKREPGERLYNKGILLLISRFDRKARIELGANWGWRWDHHAERIMDRAIIPDFKRDDFNAGILAGVEALAHMASLGPQSEPPSRIGGLMDNMDQSPWVATPLPLWGVIFLVATGSFLLLLAWLAPKQRRILAIAGIVLILSGLVLWLLLAALALFFGGRDGAGGGFSAGGGFGGGGFSGGGGATGGW